MGIITIKGINDFQNNLSTGNVRYPNEGYRVEGLNRPLVYSYISCGGHHILTKQTEEHSITFESIFFGQSSPTQIIGVTHNLEETLAALRDAVYNDPIRILAESYLNSGKRLDELKVDQYTLKDNATLPRETRVAERDITPDIITAIFDRIRSNLKT
ncbi:hypothetical protein HZB02_02920 [Candidatus Woesearchaeota archaeon]|nr:hypothetical protein [Candidatus Woesearchaeota archaeon]